MKIVSGKVSGLEKVCESLGSVFISISVLLLFPTVEITRESTKLNPLSVKPSQMIYIM